jgi:hypothetical protein
MVIAKRQSTGEWFAGFLQHFDIDNRTIPALTTARLIPFYRRTEVGDPTKAARKPRELGKADCELLVSPGPFLPMTPKTDWKILGRAICRIGCEPGLYFGRLAKRDFAVIEPGS